MGHSPWARYPALHESNRYLGAAPTCPPTEICLGLVEKLKKKKKLFLVVLGLRRVQAILQLQSTDSRAQELSSHGSQALEYRLGSCTRAQLLHRMWGLPGSGMEPVSPALAGGFFTTEPRGKPWLRNSYRQIEGI